MVAFNVRLALCATLSVVLLCPTSHAMRSLSAKDKAVAHAISYSDQKTSYGQPVTEELIKAVSIDHFSSVSCT